MPEESAPPTMRHIGDPDLHKMLVRLIAGGIGEGIDRLRELATELDNAEHDPESIESSPFAANPLTMALVGWISEWPEQISAARDGALRRARPLTTVLRVAYDTGAAIAEATGVAPFVASVTEPTRTALSEELERLSMVGTAEYARGRVLSVQAFERSVDGIVGYLGESDELGELVREQTLGVTGAAVQEIRETGAAADGLAEGIVRRLLGRERRPIPPKPVPEST